VPHRATLRRIRRVPRLPIGRAGTLAAPGDWSCKMAVGSIRVPVPPPIATISF